MGTSKARARHLRLRWRSLAPVLVACAGCSLVTNLDGLSGSPAAAGDAGDAAVDTGQVAADAAVESSPTVDGAAGCAALGAHTFCADFDGQGGLTDGWDRFRTAPGTGALDSTLFNSAPRAAVLRVAANSPTCTYAKLEKNFPGTFSKATVAFDLRLGTAAGAMPSEAQSVAGIGIGKCAIFVYPYGSKPFIYRQDDPSGTVGQPLALQSGVSVGAWHRVSLTFSTQSAPYMVVQGDGITLGTVDTLPAACQLAGGVGIGVGFHCANAQSSDLEMRADGIVVDVE